MQCNILMREDSILQATILNECERKQRDGKDMPTAFP